MGTTFGEKKKKSVWKRETAEQQERWSAAHSSLKMRDPSGVTQIYNLVYKCDFKTVINGLNTTAPRQRSE